MRKLLSVICFLIFSFFARAQGISVPAAAMPTKNNQILIDSLLKVTQFEGFFTSYCEQRIDKKAKEMKWSYQQIANVKNRINYKNFKEETLYNWYSFFTTDQLIKLIKIMKDFNADAGANSSFIANPIILQNLEAELDGDYGAAG